MSTMASVDVRKVRVSLHAYTSRTPSSHHFHCTLHAQVDPGGEVSSLLLGMLFLHRHVPNLLSNPRALIFVFSR